MTSDDILVFENEKQKDEILPLETYQFHFFGDELNEIDRLQKKNVYKRPVIFFLCCIVMIALAIGNSADSAVIGFFLGVTVLGSVSYIKGIWSFRKQWEKSVNLICKTTYEYIVFEDFIRISLYRENEKISEQKNRRKKRL